MNKKKGSREDDADEEARKLMYSAVEVPRNWSPLLQNHPWLLEKPNPKHKDFERNRHKFFRSVDFEDRTGGFEHNGAEHPIFFEDGSCYLGQMRNGRKNGAGMTVQANGTY